MTPPTTSISPSTPDIIEAEILSENVTANEADADTIEVVHLSPQLIPKEGVGSSRRCGDGALITWATSPWTIAGAALLLTGNILLAWALKPENSAHSTPNAANPKSEIEAIAAPDPQFPAPNGDRQSNLTPESLSTLQLAAVNRPAAPGLSPALVSPNPPSLAATLLPSSIGVPPAIAPLTTVQSVTPASKPNRPVPETQKTVTPATAQPLPQTVPIIGQPVPLPPPPPSSTIGQAPTSAPENPAPPTDEQRLQQILRTQAQFEQDSAPPSFYHKTQKQLQNTALQNSSGDGESQGSVVERLQQQIQRNQGN